MVAQQQQQGTNQGPSATAGGGGGGPKGYWKKSKDGVVSLVEVPKEAHENPPSNGYYRLRFTGVTDTFSLPAKQDMEASVSVRAELMVVDPGKANHGRKFSETCAVKRQDKDTGNWYNAITGNSKWGQILMAISGTQLPSEIFFTDYLNGEFMSAVTQKVVDNEYGRRVYAGTTYKTTAPVEQELLPQMPAAPLAPEPAPSPAANPYIDPDV